MKLAAALVLALASFAPSKDLTKLPGSHRTATLPSGTYFLTQPFELKNLSSFTLRAEPDAKVVISGGQKISDWTKVGKNLWQTKAHQSSSFRELFKNGTALQRARHPNTGTFRITKAGPDNRSSFFFKQDDLKAWSSPQNIEFVFYHDWSLSRVNLKSIDTSSKQAFLRDPVGQTTASHYAMSHFEKQPRYHLENHRDFLDSHGEWHLDQTSGTLSYFATENEDPNQQEFITPSLTSLLSVDGCDKITFKGISFQHCRYQLPPGGSAGVQAAFHQRRPAVGKYENARDPKPAALRITNSKNIVFENCTFSNLGASGLWIANGCSEFSVNKCEFRSIGANAIMLGDVSASEKTATRKINLSSNLIENCGTLDYGAVGIWIGIAAEIHVTGNELRELPYTGISLGWRWSPVPTASRDHLLEGNHIHHIMQKLSDGGGIYTLGLHPGTFIRKNLIHDIPVNAGRAESNGIFFDQGSTALTVEDNTIYAIARSPLRFHQAGKILVRNNTLYRKNEETPHLRFNNTPKENITDENNKIPIGRGPTNN